MSAQTAKAEPDKQAKEKNGCSQKFIHWAYLFVPAKVENLRSGFKTSDCIRGQGVTRIESGTYAVVREHFNSRNNAAIGHKVGF
jgi:hypothetical protein